MTESTDAPAWRTEARRRRAESERVWATIPQANEPEWHRGALIEALIRLGVTSGKFSGETIEGDAFFARQPTGDIRSLLRDHWYLQVRGNIDIDTTPPDVPDVPEPEFKPTSCCCDHDIVCGP